MSTLKADTIQSTGGGAATLTKQMAPKSQLCYDHANETIDGSFNVSTVHDVQTGIYAVALTNNMQPGYSHIASCASTSSFQNDVSVRGFNSGGTGSVTTQTTNGYNVTTSNGSNNNFDDEINSSLALGDLA